MRSLVVINACIREAESRTLRVAEPIVDELSRRYAITRYDLPRMDIAPLGPALYARRCEGRTPRWAEEAARAIAGADRILIAAPFWDMSFPALLKCFLEQTSLFGITFTDDGTTCKGLCKAPKVLYITTRGMDIGTGDQLEQATPYLRSLGSLWNLGELTTIAVQGTDYRTEEENGEKIASAVEEGLTLAKDW